ncbi:MAG: 50S ribosomal protein L35 [Oscillospiraceae bacterium]|nr:50S ribosomal protein L35 [Oscillospiraceae bacterium]MBR5502310.1 50S ribosomal protein L35 [Oscillospiraceae bacterium]
MPKMKTHSGAKKRIMKITKNGKIKRARAFRSHILNKMTTKRKRHLRGPVYADSTNVANLKKLLPYG